MKFPEPRTLDSKFMAYIGLNGATLDTYLDDRIYSIGEEDYSKKMNGEEIAQSLAKRFRTRQAYAVPKGIGVCFPYGFVQNNGDKFLKVGVAMRLLDHPDVEIFFGDSDATGQDPKIAPQFKGSRGVVEFFWSYYGPTKGNKIDDLLDHYHSVDLGGYKGQYAFATIARPVKDAKYASDENETAAQKNARLKKEIADGIHPLDYGFMAAYKSDLDNQDDPDLTLYVIRTASRAVAARKQPVSEEDLKKMALQIAASIQKRKTN